MPTTSTEERSTSVIAQDAYDLHDCFIDGFKDVVYDLAEAIARENGRRTADGLTEISRDDMLKATSVFFESLRNSVAHGLVPGHLIAVIEQMTDCVEGKKNGS